MSSSPDGKYVTYSKHFKLKILAIDSMRFNHETSKNLNLTSEISFFEGHCLRKQTLLIPTKLLMFTVGDFRSAN